MFELAKADGRMSLTDVPLEKKRELLRYTMMIADIVEYVGKITDHKKFELLSMHKMEMAVICLLHLELRVGENILTSICQRMMNRVSTIYFFF